MSQDSGSALCRCTLEWGSALTLPVSIHIADGGLSQVVLGCLPTPRAVRSQRNPEAMEFAWRLLDVVVGSLSGRLRLTAERNFRALKAVRADGSSVATIPLAGELTPFRKRVFRSLLRVTSGKRTTYRQLAEKVGSSPRAIGGAMRTNPWPLIVPCHRVVGASGEMVGFSASGGVRLKASLLELEAARIQPRAVGELEM